MRHPAPIRPPSEGLLRELDRCRELMSPTAKLPPQKQSVYVKSPEGSGGDANKKEVRDLCRAAVLLRFGY
jgi:hypothetical protein